MDEAKIKISIEDNADLAAKNLRELITIQQEMLGSVNKIAEAQKKENAEIRVQTGLFEKLESKLRDLKVLRNQAEDLKGVKEYNDQIKQTEAELSKLTGTTEKWGLSLKDISGLVLGVFAFDKVLEYGKSMFNTVVETERLQTALKAATSSNEEYAQSITFLNKLSDDYGQNVNVLTGSYKNFIANTKTSTLGLEEKQRIYASIVKTGSALQLSNEQLERSFYAVSQMFGKNKISAEELSTQLADVFPNSVGIMAKAVGVGTAELFKMMEQGQLLADDVLPKFAKELENAYGSKASANLQTVGGQWNRLTNSVIEFSSKANEATGFTKTLASGIAFVADNFSSVVKYVGMAVTTLVAYQVATKGVAVAKAAWLAIEQAGLIIKGQAILALEGYTGMTIATTAAQTRATAAAATFNATLAANPFGIVLTALTALTIAYTYYEDEAKKAQKAQLDLALGLSEAERGLVKEQRAFNDLAVTVLNTNLTLKEREQALKRLQEMHPEQMKGIDNIKDAEIRLGGVMSVINGQYVQRIELAKLAYLAEKSSAQSNQYLDERIKLEERLKTAQTERTGLISKIWGKSEADLIKERINDLKGLEYTEMAYSDNLAKQSAKITSELTGNYKKEVAAAEGAAAGVGKANKKKEESLVDLEKARARFLANTKSNYDETIKATNAHIQEYLKSIRSGSEKETKDRKDLVNSSMKLLDQQHKYILEMNYLRKLATATSTKEIAQIEKEYRDETLKSELRHHQLLLDENQAKISKLKALVSNGDRESIALLTEAQNERLILQENYDKTALAIAKNRADDNKKIVEDGEEKKTEVVEKAGKKRKSIFKNLSDEEIELIKNVGNTIVAITDAALSVYGAMWEDRMSKANTETEKALLENERMWAEWGASATGIVNSFIQGGLWSGLASAIAWVGQGIGNLFTANKRKAEAALADLRIYYEEQIAIWQEFMDGSQSDIEKYYGTLMNLNKEIKDYGDNIGNIDPKEIIENELRRAEQINKTYDKAVSLEKEYYELQKKNAQDLYNYKVSLIEQEYGIKADNANIGISAETAAVKQGMADQLLAMITNEDSKTSVTSEYAAKRKTIEEAFYLADEGRRDVLKGDLESLNGQLGSAQSDLAGINEELNSTAGITEERRAELVKTKGELEGVITTLKATIGTTQNEYDAVTASIKERNAALDELLDWYVDELDAIVNSEGQKRTEYTATEEIRRQGEEAIKLLQMQNAQDEIIRTRDKNEAILEAQKELNASLENLAVIHNQNILNLTLARDEAIKASWELVSAVMLAGYQAQIDAAYRAYSVGAMTLEQLKEMVNEVNRLLAIAGAGTVDLGKTQERLHNEIDNQVDNQVGNRHNFAGWGEKTKAEYLEHLKSTQQPDTKQSRIDFVNKKFSEWFSEQSWLNRSGNNPFWNPDKKFNEHWESAMKYATGTESVQSFNHPDGIDTVPAMLTKRERVMSVADNAPLLQAGLSNKQVMQYALNWDDYMKTSLRVSDLPVLKISPHVAQTLQEQKAMETLMNMNMQPVIDKLDSLEKAFASLPINNFNLDENGLHKWVKKGNATTKYNKKRFGS